MSFQKLKVVLMLSVAVALTGLGSGRGQDVTPPGSPVAPLPDVSLPLLVPQPPTVEQLRKEYATVHGELANFLTMDELSKRSAAASVELKSARERVAQAEREKRANGELERAAAALKQIATTYPGTAAGAKAQEALDRMTAPAKTEPKQSATK